MRRRAHVSVLNYKTVSSSEYGFEKMVQQQTPHKVALRHAHHAVVSYMAGATLYTGGCTSSCDNVEHHTHACLYCTVRTALPTRALTLR